MVKREGDGCGSKSPVRSRPVCAYNILGRFEECPASEGSNVLQHHLCHAPSTSSLTILQIRRLGVGVFTFWNLNADLRGLSDKDIDACGLESSMSCLGFPPLSVNRLTGPHLSHTLPWKTGDCSKMSHPVVASSRQLWTTTAFTYFSNVGRPSGLSASRLLQLTNSLSLSLTTLSSSMLALVPGL